MLTNAFTGGAALVLGLLLWVKFGNWLAGYLVETPQVAQRR